jgi:hypothetical protein
MRDNTMTLRMNGSISLKKFAHALNRFYALVSGLSQAKRARDVEWVVADLSVSSTLATVAGVGEADRVFDVIEGYAEVGEALQNGRPLPYGRRVSKPAHDLRAFVGNGVESVTFDTFHGDAVISAKASPLVLLGQELPEAPRRIVGTTRLFPPSYGAVSGQVETLARRNTLRFILYDTLNNKAVSCYVAEGDEDKLRDIWGQSVTVEGLITRDPIDGRPMSVRRITSIAMRQTRQISHRDARGASPHSAIPPEELIRRIRDGW